jgi:hypothetical protein
MKGDKRPNRSNRISSNWSWWNFSQFELYFCVRCTGRPSSTRANNVSLEKVILVIYIFLRRMKFVLVALLLNQLQSSSVICSSRMVGVPITTWSMNRRNLTARSSGSIDNSMYIYRSRYFEVRPLFLVIAHGRISEITAKRCCTFIFRSCKVRTWVSISAFHSNSEFDQYPRRRALVWPR